MLMMNKELRYYFLASILVFSPASFNAGHFLLYCNKRDLHCESPIQSFFLFLEMDPFCLN